MSKLKNVRTCQGYEEFLNLIRKYNYTYADFEFIVECLRREIETHTHIDINDNMKD